MGLPHSMVEDEVINGVLYPKDSVIFINLCMFGLCNIEIPLILT